MQKAPNWKDILTQEGILERSFTSPELSKLIKKAQDAYLYWDTFKYQPVPDGFTSEEAWAILKLNRSSLYEKTPVKSVDGHFFDLAMVNSLQQKLNFIDTHTLSFFKDTKFSESEEYKFIIAGLTEEAIATSQIEGANTTRKVAKEMLASQRKPRTKSEQMIVNSYQIMQKIEAWKDLDLSLDMLLDIQSIVTEKACDHEGDQGRFRIDDDNIVVTDRLTGEIIHTPPCVHDMYTGLSDLIKYVNMHEEESGGNFIHPVVKASIIHFWIAYLHPFPDGNGRTARAVFYWYLLKKNYGLIRYLSVSRAIVHSRKKYDNAFIYSECEYDLTYFLLYVAESFKISIEKFIEYVHEKIGESELFKKMADNLQEFNPRQIALLNYFMNHEDGTTEVAIHQAKHGISRQTAHTDLITLVKKGLLTQTSKKRKFVFVPNTHSIRKLLQS